MNVQPSNTPPSLTDGKMSLHAQITKDASKQTYYTIRFLVDRDRVQDAFRSHAYLRWLDDLLDTLPLLSNRWRICSPGSKACWKNATRGSASKPAALKSRSSRSW